MPELAAKVSVSAARWLVGVIAAVVLSFLLATIVAQHLESAIGTRSHDIAENAMPSVQLLTRALGDLDRLDYDLDQYAGLPVGQRSRFQAQIIEDRQDIGRQLVAYVEQPQFPGEPELFAVVQHDLRDLDSLISAFLPSGDHGELTRVHRQLDQVEESIQSVVELNATQGQQAGREIGLIRRKSRGLVTWLDALSVLLAIAAAVLALRQLRRSRGFLERERIAARQREAELESHAEALGDFAGRVAHDIVSPLSTVLLSIERMRQSCEADTPTSRSADRGIAAVRRVHGLVDDLLAFSRAGGHPDPGSSVEIASVIEETIDELAPQARQQHIALNVAALPNVAVACSRGVLTSLVSNLVRNAIRYMGSSVERRIDVRVFAAGDRVHVDVQDTGPGIPLDQQKHIFEPYVQVARGGEGIGLGLATVSRLVRAHDGAVGVDSQPGHGSRFWFELPACVQPRASL